MKSNIKIKMKFSCIIGLYNFERHIKQRIRLKIHIKANSFIDYAQLQLCSKRLYKREKFKTLEESLKSLSKELSTSFVDVEFLKLSVCKLDILKNAKASVILKKKFKS